MLYREIVDADKIGFSADQIAAMKGWEKRTVDRYLSISRYPVMEKMLAEGMPYSKLASIADKLKSKPKLKEGTVAFFEKWLSKSVPGRRAKKREEAAKKNKDLKEEALQLGKLLEPGEYEGWIRDLDAGEVPTGKSKVKKVNVITERGVTTVDGVKINYETSTEFEIAQTAVAYQKAVVELERQLERKRAENARANEAFDEEAMLKKYGLDKPVPTETDTTSSTPEGDESFDEDADAGKKKSRKKA